MNIARGVGRWLLSLVIAMMITAWVSLSVLQSTVLNRSAVQGWLRDSGAYQTALDSVIRLQDQNTEQNATQPQSLATMDDFKKALLATFPPSYVQAQSEKVVDATYDWIEDKSQTIAFTIPVNEKQPEFVANVTKQIESKLAALPQCPTRVNPNASNPTCIPQGMSTTELAARLTPELTTESGKFLEKPLTAKDLGFSSPSSVAWLPPTYANAKWASVVLPIAIVVAVAVYILLSSDKLKGLSTISRRILLNGLFLMLGGGALWYVGGKVDVSGWLADMNLSSLINPIFQQIVPSIGRALTFMGGGIALAASVSWVVALVLKRRQEHTTTHMHRPPELPQPPVSPENPSATPRPPSVT